MCKRQSDVRFWLSRKFWLEVMAAGVFLTLQLSGSMDFSEEQAMIFVISLAGLGVVAHTVTDIMSQFGLRSSNAVSSSDRVTPVETPIPRSR